MKESVKKGSSYQVFNKRRMRPEVVQCCARDVEMFQNLYQVYGAKLAPSGQLF
jgi:hypothetical protein